MTKDVESETEPVVIKKYANRRLYNTDTSTYVTLDDLAEMVRSERDFVVYDAKTREDLTHAVLTQIIVEQESKGQNLLPIRFLRQLIRFYGNSIEGLVPSYLEFSLDSLTRQQERYRQQFTDAFSTPAIEAMQEQARNNFAMFEKAMGMFSPFPPTEANENIKDAESADGVQDTGKGKAANSTGKAPANGDEIADLKAQLSAMQEKLDQLSRGST